MSESEYKEQTKRALLENAINKIEIMMRFREEEFLKNGQRAKLRRELEGILKMACPWLSEDSLLVRMWYGRADRLELTEDRSRLFDALQDCYRLFNGYCENCEKAKGKADEIRPILEEVRSHMEVKGSP